jgi:predicted permease
MPPEEARRDALRRFGDVERVRGELVEHDERLYATNRRIELMSDFVHDIRFGLRSLRREPGVTAGIVLTLALGLGVNMAMFSFLDVVFLRPPAGVHEPGEVRRVWTEINFMSGPQFWSGYSYPQYAALRSSLGDRVATAMYRGPEDMWVGRDADEAEVRVSSVTASYFELLGTRPARGRFFTADEDRPGAGNSVVVASHEYWRRNLGANPDALGREIYIASKPYTLIGVAAERFSGVELDATELWLPMGVGPGYGGRQWWRNHNVNGFQILLRPLDAMGDAALEQRIAAALRAPDARRAPADTVHTVRLGSIVRAQGPGSKDQEVKIAMRLAGVTIIVLLIAGANVINLLLARAVRRRREIAVRLAMGISRLRLARLLLTESVLLATMAAAAAVLAAYWGGEVLRGLLMPEVKWATGASTLHWRVLALALAAGVGAGLIAGLLPAIQSANLELTGALKAGSGGSAQSSGRSRAQSTLVVAQAALSVVLLVGAGLFVASLNNVRELRTGFDARRIVYAGVQFDIADSARAARFPQMLRGLADRMRGTPGVEEVALAMMPPTRGFGSITFLPDVDTTRYKRPFATYNLVSPEFLAATGMRLVRGQDFPRGAGATMPPVVIVNEAMARAQWPGMEVLGRCMQFPPENRCFRVIGVAETAMFNELLETPQAQYYLPLDNPPEKAGRRFETVIIRTGSGTAARDLATAEVQRAIRETFPDGRPTVATMEQYLEPEYRPWRMGATLFTAFGFLALLVAALGIYSTVAYMVAQRTHEFGVRTALGAQTSDILRQVIGTSIRTVAIGVGAGIVLAIIGGRFVAALLYGIEPGDPLVMGAVAIALLLVAAGAALGPAWRAARVDPVTALRVD